MFFHLAENLGPSARDCHGATTAPGSVWIWAILNTPPAGGAFSARHFYFTGPCICTRNPKPIAVEEDFPLEVSV
jgi:hypothetical protein